jgi:hypothetical protein
LRLEENDILVGQDIKYVIENQGRCRQKIRIYLKKKNQGLWPGADRRKSGVPLRRDGHSEPIHNAAMDTWNIFEISFHDFTRLERSIIPAHGY